VPIDRDDHDERIARIDMLLEELRANTEDIQGHAKNAVERARQSREALKATIATARRIRASKSTRDKP
jgi:hypothetical protein